MSWLKTVLGLSHFWLQDRARREDALVLEAETRTEMLASTGALLEKHLKLEAIIGIGLFEEIARALPDASHSIEAMTEEHRKAARAVAALRETLLARDAPIGAVELQRFRVLLEEGHRWTDRILGAAPPEIKKALQEYDRRSSDS